MEFCTLLAAHGLVPTQTALCLHKPGNPHERLALTQMAESEPALFDAYQRTHPRQAEATLKARRIMASFLTRGDGTLVFLGLWRQDGWQDRSPADLFADPDFRTMRERIRDPRLAEATAPAASRASFTLTPMAELAELVGRLIVADPGARAYMRLAETTPLPVLQITPKADLSPPLPDWDTLILDAATLRAIPARWAEVLRHWRGIYLITDTQDGARYVGSAYGEDNLLGRWQAHVAGQTGVTLHLARRNPSNFLFSILELLSPAAPADAVIRAEHGWMRRLHTRQFGLNS